MYRLYDFLASGNGYKCRLLLHHLDLPFERVEVDILRGESRTEAFGRLNPEQRVPVLELEDGTVLPESNAILCYLAEGTPWWPAGAAGPRPGAALALLGAVQPRAQRGHRAPLGAPRGP